MRASPRRRINACGKKLKLRVLAKALGVSGNPVPVPILSDSLFREVVDLRIGIEGKAASGAAKLKEIHFPH